MADKYEIINKFDYQINKSSRNKDFYNLKLSRLSKNIFTETCNWDVRDWKRFRNSIPNYYQTLKDQGTELQQKTWKRDKIRNFKREWAN